MHLDVENNSQHACRAHGSGIIVLVMLADAPKIKRLARTMSNLGADHMDLQVALDAASELQSPAAASLRSHASVMPPTTLSKPPVSKLSKRTSMPSEMLRHVASEMEAIAAGAAHPSNIGEQSGCRTVFMAS